MIGPAHHYGKTITQRILFKLFFSDGAVFPQPLFWRKSFKSGGEFTVYFIPRLLEIGRGDWVGNRPIRIVT